MFRFYYMLLCITLLAHTYIYVCTYINARVARRKSWAAALDSGRLIRKVRWLAPETEEREIDGVIFYTYAPATDDL